MDKNEDLCKVVKNVVKTPVKSLKKFGFDFLVTCCTLILLISLFSCTVSAISVNVTGDEVRDAAITATSQDLIPPMPENNQDLFAEMPGPGSRTLEMDTVGSSGSQLDVLLVGADYSANSLTSILTGFPDIGTVNFFDVASGTPTLAELQQYDVAIVWSNRQYLDRVALGDVLADYVDSGGYVIIQVFSWYGPTWNLQGRIISEEYSPFVQDGDNGNYYSTASLGLYDVSHPIMKGVNSMSDEYRDSVVLSTGAELVAEWDDGEEFIATKDSVVGINSYPGDYYQWTGDYPTILHNTILWFNPVKIHSPQAITNDSTPLLNATFNPASFNPAALAWYVLDGNNGSNQTNTYNLTVTLPQLDDGMHNITVYAMDSEGNTSERTLDFLVDTIAPEPVIGPVPSPASPNVLINGTFVEEGSGIASVVVNGVSAAVNEENSSYSATGLPLVDGENLITVLATDKAGNTGTAEMNITVDAIPPFLNITAPAGDRVWFVDNIVKGTASDINFASAVLVVKNEAGAVVSRYELDIQPDNSFRERVEYFPEQLNTLELIAYDTVGNANISRKTVYVENNTVQDEVPSVNESEIVEIDSVNETGASIEFVSGVNANNVTFTVNAITNETAMESLNNSSSAFGELAVGKMVEINATGGLDGSNESQVGYVRISLFYSMDDLDLDGDGEIGPGDIDEASLSVYWYNESSGNWVKLLKGNPEWVIDAGRSPITGDGQGSVWVKVKHLSSYSLTGALIPEAVPAEPEEHNGGSGFGHAVIISRSEVSGATGQDAGTADGNGSGLEITPEGQEIPANETLGEEASEKETPNEEESEGSPGFGSIFAAAGLAVSAVCLRRRML